MENDVVYFTRRAREERQAASRAASATVRDTHLQLAQAYERRVHDIATQQRRSAMRLVSSAA